MQSSTVKLYWDSCVFISAIERTADRYEVLRDLLGLARSGRDWLVTSAITIAEVTRIHSESKTSAQQIALINQFFENPYISVRAVDRKVASQAQKIGAGTKLSPTDAIHIATAIEYQCAALHTYDGDNSRRRRRDRMIAHSRQFGHPRLPIEPPSVPAEFHDPQKKLL